MIPGLVSVIIPVYNGQRYLDATLATVFSQTYTNVEVIAVDDGSSDDSAAILRRHSDRVTVITQPNRGCASARQAGLMRASGEFVAFLDQDDEWEPTKLERQVAVLQANPLAVAVYCDHHGIDESGRRGEYSGACFHPVYSGLIFELLIRSNCIVSASLVMARRKALDAVGGFDTTQPYWADDWDLWMRLAATGPLLFMLEDLAGYRRHGANTSSATSFEMSAGNLHALLNVGPFVQGQAVAVQRAYERALYVAHVAVGWQHRLKGNRMQAIRSYLSAWRMRPGALSLLARCLAIALLPRRVLIGR